MIGKIIKNISNTYTVYSDFKTYELKPRGIIKYNNQDLKVGDIVEFDSQITKVLKRKNSFLRPFISNVDYSIIVTSLKEPDINFELLDRFIVLSLSENVEPILIFTKLDKLSLDEFNEVDKQINYYKKFYTCFYSDKSGIKNKDELISILKNKTSFVSGQTGAGKSHLLNTLSPNLSLKTQEISMSLNRGKHTTRHTEIMFIDEMFIADTPGFSSFELNIESKELKNYFIEFTNHLNECKYNECSHTHEPDCIIKEMVNDGSILKSRYDSYLKFYNELKENEKNRYR